jgi:hypothetical protein
VLNRCTVLLRGLNFVGNFFFFLDFRRFNNCEKLLFCHVCPSVRMEQLGSDWTDFYEIRYLGSFRKYVEKIQVSLRSDKNNGTLHEDQ